MENAKHGFLSMRHGIKISKKQSPKVDKELKRMSDIPYASAVGSIQYAVQCTGPDISHALSMMSYNDASFELDDDDAKSQLDFVFKLNGGVVAWKSSEVIAQAKESRSHHRSKHILKCYHLLREMVSRGDVRMDRVSSIENTTDRLTKPMSQITHARHLDKMGLRSMGD
ncbi:UNVERIFIED_CONTAM: hypothetical protein Sindi_1679400 [Sesamum indicum]